MTNCTFQNRLSAYFDDELPDEQHTAMESHMASCPACAAELEAYGRLSRALKAELPATLSGPAMDRLRSKVRVYGQQRWWRESAGQFDRTVRRVTAVAAVIMVAAATALLLLPAKAADTAKANEAIVETLASSSAEPGTQTSLAATEDRQMAQWIVADLTVQDDVKSINVR